MLAQVQNYKILYTFWNVIRCLSQMNINIFKKKDNRLSVELTRLSKMTDPYVYVVSVCIVFTECTIIIER